MKQTEKNYLIGTGGCGMEFIQNKYHFDQHTHIRNMFIPIGVNFVYIFAHPYDVLMSFSKRNMLMGAHAICAINGDHASSNMGGVVDLSTYLKQDIDCFQFGHHFNNYYSLNVNGIFIKYECFESQLDVHMAKLGIKKKADILFRKRSSNYNDLDDSTLFKLEQKHGKYAEHFDSLPHVFINEVKEDKFFWNKRWDNE